MPWQLRRAANVNPVGQDPLQKCRENTAEDKKRTREDDKRNSQRQMDVKMSQCAEGQPKSDPGKWPKLHETHLSLRVNPLPSHNLCRRHLSHAERGLTRKR